MKLLPMGKKKERRYLCHMQLMVENEIEESCCVRHQRNNFTCRIETLILKGLKNLPYKLRASNVFGSVQKHKPKW